MHLTICCGPKKCWWGQKDWGEKEFIGLNHPPSTNTEMISCLLHSIESRSAKLRFAQKTSVKGKQHFRLEKTPAIKIKSNPQSKMSAKPNLDDGINFAIVFIYFCKKWRNLSSKLCKSNVMCLSIFINRYHNWVSGSVARAFEHHETFDSWKTGRWSQRQIHRWYSVQ